MKAIVWLAAVIFPGAGMADHAPPPADELASLIERCCGNGREDELIAAVRLRVGEFVAAPRNNRNRAEDPTLPVARPNQDWLLAELGHHVLATAGTPDAALPPVGRLSKPHRLGPLFDGMLPDRFEKTPATKLRPLLPLVTPEWLAAAAACGAFDFVHTVRLLRGELNDLLRAYQLAENGTGLLHLGSVLGRFPELAEQVEPTGFATGTLALLLSGAFSDGNFQGQPAAVLAIACGKWSAHHPGLVDELERITPAIGGVGLCRIARCSLGGDRGQAQRLIAGVPDFYQESVRQLLHALQSAADPDGPEAVAAARAMTTGQLTGVLGEMLDINRHDDRELERAMPLLRELLTRRDLPEGPPSLRHPAHTFETALRWWLAGRDRQAYDLLRLCFLTYQAQAPEDALFRVANLARLLGKEAELAADVNPLAAAWGERRFRGHRQVLRKSAGHQPDSAAERWANPEWIADGKAIEALLGDAAAALAFFRSLPPATRENYAPWLVLSGNGSAPATPQSPAPADSAGVASRGLTIALETPPGTHSDPRAPVFKTLDAMGEVRRLVAAGDVAPARELFELTLIRCLLDEREPKQVIHLAIQGLTDQRGGRVTAGFQVSPWDMAMVAICCWNLDEPFLREHVLLEARRGTGIGLGYAGLPFARYLARHGACAEARAAAIAYQVPVGHALPHRLPLLAETDGLAQAAAGRTDNALLRLDALMTLSPADPAPAKAIIACLAKHGGNEAAATAKSAVREFWRLQSGQHPDDATVREAARRWLDMLEAP